MEIIIPLIMMWILSLIHSQIVATSPPIESKNITDDKLYKTNGSRMKKKYNTFQNISSKTDMEKVHNIRETSSKFFRRKFDHKRLHSSQIGCEEGLTTRKKSRNKIPKSNSVKESCICYNQKENEKALDGNLHRFNVCSTDSESEIEKSEHSDKMKNKYNSKKRSKPSTVRSQTVMDNLCDSDNEISIDDNGVLLGDISSATEWMGVTTNSEDCSYSSDIDNISENNVEPDDCVTFDSDLAPTAILNPPCLKVSCIIWESNEIMKADLSMLDISSAIIRKVNSMPESLDYFYFGIMVSTILSCPPLACQVFSMISDNSSEEQFIKEWYKNITSLLDSPFSEHFEGKTYKTVAIHILQIPELISGYIYHIYFVNTWDLIITVISSVQRWILATVFFFLLCVAERTFKQRLLYAKLFCHLTSLRRAKKSDLPHFRLNKVRNIKTWLSVRSYLKKRGPQRSVDVIVSTAFIVNLLLLIFLCVELLKETVIVSQYYLEALVWCLGLGAFLLRFMTLGTKINKKYRNLSVLLTEQINLHLQIEQKPHKKDEFTLANNVLKLAIDLLKELENPFKIYGFSANPILYNVTKLVILSALSGVLSEMLGFKLKLHKIKLK